MTVAVLFLFSSAIALAQPYTISTFAGGAPPVTPIASLKASIFPVGGMAVDESDLYFTSNSCVFKLDVNGVITRVAGNSRAGHTGDGGPAINAEIGGAGQVVFDHSGNFYVADSALPNAGMIREISTDGTIRTVASGENLLPASGPFLAQRPFAVDESDNLYFIDGVRIRKLATNGTITTVVGQGAPVAWPQGAVAHSIAVDRSGNLYIAGLWVIDEDTGYGRIWMVTEDGNVQVLAGATSGGIYVDGPASSAQLQGFLPAILADRTGNIFFLDGGRVRKIGTDGMINSFPTAADVGSCGPAGFVCGFDLALDAAGRIYVEVNNEGTLTIRMLDAGGNLTIVAGGGPGNNGDGGLAVNAPLRSPLGIAVDVAHNVYIGDETNRIRRVAADGTIATAAGNGMFRIPGAPTGDGGPALDAELACVPTSFSIPACKGVAADESGNFYFSDGDRVRKVSPDGTIATVASVKAHGLASDGKNVYMADPYGAQIWKLTPDGALTAIAGTGTNGRSGDGGQAINAQLFIPVDVALDSAGNIYVAEMYDSRVRKVTPDGTITTIAGGGKSGDGPALSTLLAPNLGIAADRDGNVYVAEYDTNRIRKISTSGTISTIAGGSCDANGRCFGYTGDGGTATNALLNGPVRVAVDSDGNVYVADRDNDAIRVLRPAR